MSRQITFVGVVRFTDRVMVAGYSPSEADDAVIIKEVSESVTALGACPLPRVHSSINWSAGYVSITSVECNGSLLIAAEITALVKAHTGPQRLKVAELCGIIAVPCRCLLYLPYSSSRGSLAPRSQVSTDSLDF